MPTWKRLLSGNAPILIPAVFFHSSAGMLAWMRVGTFPLSCPTLQILADEWGNNSLFVLTGSEQFKLSDAISQSLAGRTALLRLLPFPLAERQKTGVGVAVDDILYSGFYPRILNQGLDPRKCSEATARF